jgi:hypothetical protein
MNRYGAFLAVLLGSAVSAHERPAGPPVLLQARDLPVAVDAKALQQQFDALSSMPGVAMQRPPPSLPGSTAARITVLAARSADFWIV